MEKEENKQEKKTAAKTAKKKIEKVGVVPETPKDVATTDPKGALLKYFDKVMLAKPRTLVLIPNEDLGGEFVLCDRYAEVANLALATMYGRTVYGAKLWMNPKRHRFSNTCGLNMTVTVQFGSNEKVQQAFKDLLDLFNSK